LGIPAKLIFFGWVGLVYTTRNGKHTETYGTNGNFHGTNGYLNVKHTEN
jgi:hypothetical protein